MRNTLCLSERELMKLQTIGCVGLVSMTLAIIAWLCALRKGGGGRWRRPGGRRWRHEEQQRREQSRSPRPRRPGAYGDAPERHYFPGRRHLAGTPRILERAPRPKPMSSKRNRGVRKRTRPQIPAAFETHS